MAKTLFSPEWFPYYFERFEGSDRVAAMSLAEEGAYHRAIRLAWKYGTVPADPELLAAKIQKRCTPKIASKVLTTFEPVPENPSRMFHPVLETVRAEQEVKHLNKVRGGKASAEARNANEANKDRSSTSQAEVSSAQAQVAQIKIKTKTESKKKEISDEISFKRLILRACEKNFPNEDPRLVEIGILYTMLQRNGSTEPIKSARYFDPEIKKVLKDSKGMSSETIDALLARRREQFFGEESK
jgi:hypothetical protein